MSQSNDILHSIIVSEQYLPQVKSSDMNASDQFRPGNHIVNQLALQPPRCRLISGAASQPDQSAIISQELITIEICNNCLIIPEAHFALIVLDDVLGNDVNAPSMLPKLWRLLEPNGRIIIHDQFLPEPGQYQAWLALMGQVMMGMRQAPIWHLSDILRHSDLICIEQNEPDPLHPFYRWVTLSKPLP